MAAAVYGLLQVFGTGDAGPIVITTIGVLLLILGLSRRLQQVAPTPISPEPAAVTPAAQS
jgi:hypothetical protein